MANVKVFCRQSDTQTDIQTDKQTNEITGKQTGQKLYAPHLSMRRRNKDEMVWE